MGTDGHPPADVPFERTTIRVRRDGPLLVSGPVWIVDAEGRPLQLPESGAKNNLALCRCGHSRSAPFCDGRHRQVGYRSEVRGLDGEKSGPDAVNENTAG